MFDFLKNVSKPSNFEEEIRIINKYYEEQKRQQKCKEIQIHINHLIYELEENEKIWENGWGCSDDWKGGMTGYGGISSKDVSNNIDYYRQEIIKYGGWFYWWKYTSIENIIKEKGQDYTKW